MRNEIPDLNGSIVFTDFARQESHPHVGGVSAYTKVRTDCKLNDFGIIVNLIHRSCRAYIKIALT